MVVSAPVPLARRWPVTPATVSASADRTCRRRSVTSVSMEHTTCRIITCLDARVSGKKNIKHSCVSLFGLNYSLSTCSVVVHYIVHPLFFLMFIHSFIIDSIIHLFALNPFIYHLFTHLLFIHLSIYSILCINL